MGWFDESDEEDEEPKAATLMNRNNADEQEQDEDPLDAYMKSLEQQQQQDAPKRQRAERLDVQGEEEATSHWTERPKPTKTDDDINRDDDADASARQAMASTFHRAGGQEADESHQKKHQQVTLTLDKVQHDTMIYAPFAKDFWTPTDTTLGHEWRSQHQTTCTPGNIDPIYDFTALGDVFGDDLLNLLNKKGYHTPTLVQSQTLPVALAGNDALVTAATGSGKTLAYVWPMVVHVCDQDHLGAEETGPIGLVLVPTRELAIQVQQHVKTMLQAYGGKSVAITGGIAKYQLVQDLAKSGGGVEVVVATPGRFLDVLSVKKGKKGGMTLSRVTFVVLDEADKMLDMGFESQVTEILKNIRPDRQSLLLSATMGKKVERVAQKWLSHPHYRIAVGKTGEASEHVQQHVMVLPSNQAKMAWMMEMMPTLAGVGKTLVFVSTREGCEELATALRTNCPSLEVVETLHGDKHQTDRNAALRAFARGPNAVLVATDVAARGLDVKMISTVVNFNVAKNLDAHVHRIGRAGRLDRKEEQQNKGTAYTLLTPQNADFAHILVNAFQREGREISTELQALAHKSKRSGNVEKRTRWNKSGLGFRIEDHQNNDDRASAPPSTGNGNYYGPASPEGQPPNAKRSRWG